MDPFSIVCTTCKSRLKVRSTAAVGQVIPCPKCGGMVLIKLPEEAVPAEVANAATKPVEQQGAPSNPHNTKEFDDVEAILAGKAPVPATTPPRNERPAGPSEPKTSGNQRQAEPVKGAVAGGPSRAAAEERPAPAPLGTDDSPPPAQPRRYAAWLAASILAGIFLAVAVVVVSGWLLRDGGSKVAAKPVQDQSPVEQVPASSAAPSAAEKSATNQTPKAEAVAKRSEPAKSATPPVEDKPQAEAKSPAPMPQPAPDEDPLKIAGPVKPPAAAPQKATPAADDPLGKFADVLNGGNDNPLPAAEAAPALPEKPMAEPPPDVAARPALPRPPPRIVNVKARLDDPLPGIDVPGVPLADFLADLSSLSTIPITLQPEGLAVVEVSPETPVSLKLENTTVGKALAEALRPMHLEFAVVEDQMVVSLGGKLNDRSLAVDDLTGKSEQQAQQLADLTTALVDPDAWKEGDDEGAGLTPGIDQFAVRASDQTYAAALHFLEKLRVARGLSPRSKRPPELFRLQTRTAMARESLATPITLNFSQPTLLVRILDRLEETAKVRILVDWQALASQEWNTDGEGTMIVENKPLSDALDALLAPMELAWRAVDEQTLQVTSAAALAQSPELEIYPAGDLAADAAAGDALLARLQSTLAVPEEEAAAHALRFDPVSRCVLAFVPQPQQRQIERLLTEWRDEAKPAAR